MNKPLVPGSFTPWSGTFSQKTDFQEFWDSCAQNKTSEISKNGLSEILKVHFVEIVDVICFNKARFLEKVLPQAAQLPQASGFLQKDTLLRNSSAPGSAAAPYKWRLQTKNIFLGNNSAPGSEAAANKWFLPIKNRISGKSSAPGSAAAPDKWLNQKNLIFEKKFCPRQRSCPRQVACSKKQSDA